MIGKAAILLLAALLSVVSANESLRGSTNSGVEELLNQILAKLETQDKTIETLNLRVTELETQMVEDRGSYMSRRLNETDYDDDDCLPKYNSTLGYCVFDMPLKISEDTVFDGEVSFESETFFFDDVAIFDDLRIGNDNNDATLTVGGAARFESFTYFEEDVEFEDDVLFLDDVTIEGSDPDRSSRDATDFMVVGNVDVTFEEDSMLMVDTDALFRGDVTIACDEDDVDDFDGRLLEEDEINAGGKDGLSRGKNKQRRLSHKSRKSCNDPPSLLAQQAKIQELKVDELQVAGTVTADTLTADTVTADTVTADTFEVADSDTVGDPGILTKLDSSGLFLAQGAIDTNGGGIDTGDGAITTGAGDITSTGTITAGTFLP